MSEVWEKMNSPKPVESEVGPNQNNLKNYEDLQHIARNTNPTLWAPGKNFIFWPPSPKATVN